MALTFDDGPGASTASIWDHKNMTTLSASAQGTEMDQATAEQVRMMTASTVSREVLPAALSRRWRHHRPDRRRPADRGSGAAGVPALTTAARASAQ